MAYERKTVDYVEIRFETEDGEKFFMEKEIKNRKDFGKIKAFSHAKLNIKDSRDSKVVYDSVEYELFRIGKHLL